MKVTLLTNFLAASGSETQEVAKIANAPATVNTIFFMIILINKVKKLVLALYN